MFPSLIEFQYWPSHSLLLVTRCLIHVTLWKLSKSQYEVVDS